MPPWLDEAGELLTWLTIASIIAGALTFTARKCVSWLRDTIREEIANHTQLIQPTSNGGKSLPDIARRLDIVMSHLGIEEKHE